MSKTPKRRSKRSVKPAAPKDTTDVIYVVDRIEGNQVVLVDDDEGQVNVARKELSVRVREGTVLRVPMKNKKPVWENAVVDKAEQDRRLAENQERLEKLQKKDPGGDLTL